MSVRHRKYVNMGLVPNYDINNIPLEVVKEIKDLGVCFDSVSYTHLTLPTILRV